MYVHVRAQIQEKLEGFKANLPLITAMLNPGMRDRHWKNIADQIGKSVQPNDMTTLLSLLDNNVGDHIDKIQEASDAASKEFSLEKVREHDRTFSPPPLAPHTSAHSPALIPDHHALSPSLLLIAALYGRRSTRCSTSGSRSSSTAWSTATRARTFCARSTTSRPSSTITSSRRRHATA
jgi:hypothetical protein